VQRIRKDGKVDLSLTPSGLAGIDNARDVLLKALRQAGGKLQLGDRSDPDDIRATLGLSKKAFKRAAGLLYRERKVRVEDLSIELIDD
jgi:predicted RNA-binding protein (virulence factor B family)